MASSSMLEDSDDSRVVLHLDLDCFCAWAEDQTHLFPPA